MPCALSDGPGRPSFYSESDVRAWLANRAKQAGTPDNGGLDPREQKELWQARLAEQQHQLRAGELLRAADVEKVWAASVFATRALILNVPATYADRIARAANLDGAAGVEAELKDMAYEVLRELADEGRPLPVEMARPETPAKPAPATIGRDAFVRHQEPQS